METMICALPYIQSKPLKDSGHSNWLKIWWHYHQYILVIVDDIINNTYLSLLMTLSTIHTCHCWQYYQQYILVIVDNIINNTYLSLLMTLSTIHTCHCWHYQQYILVIVDIINNTYLSLLTTLSTIHTCHCCLQSSTCSRHMLGITDTNLDWKRPSIVIHNIQITS